MNEKILTLEPAKVYQKGGVFVEKKAKTFYKVKDHPDLLIMRYLDVVTSDNGEKREEVPGKGQLNAEISNMLLRLLHGKYVDRHCSIPIKTHYIGTSLDDPVECLVWRTNPIPIEVIVRNLAYGSFAERYGIEPGTRFDEPTCEFTQKDDTHDDPLIPVDHIRALGIATESEVMHMRETALSVNRILSSFFREIDIELVDFKLVFGRLIDIPGDPCSLRIIGEISPDTCRLRDLQTGEILDKDIFRQGLPGLSEAYASVSQKMLQHSEYEKQQWRHKDIAYDGYGNSLK